MDNQDNNSVSIKDLPIYHWHNKEEGKEEYARFAKQFKLSLKHLRCLLEPGGVLRRLGPHPAPAPALAAARSDWRDDMIRYEAKITKVEEHFAAALSALESSFAFATSPRHIIDVATENPPAWEATSARTKSFTKCPLPRHTIKISLRGMFKLLINLPLHCSTGKISCRRSTGTGHYSMRSIAEIESPT